MQRRSIPINPQELIDELLSKDFDYFITELLSGVPSDMDTRQGSIMYDALAPVAHKQAEQQIDMANIVKQAYASTATGEFLDWHAEGKGMSREEATNAKVQATVLDDNKNKVTSVNVGDRFASIGNEPIFYTVISNADGNILLQSETPGTKPNTYIDQILPVTPNDSINWAEITSLYAPARDDEDDDSLRARILSPNSYINYGGNINDYKAMIANIKDVGAVQVYSAWRGGGTVKLAILDNDYNTANQTLLNEVQEALDPQEDSGLGYGLAPIGHHVTVVTPELFDITVQVHVIDDGKIGHDILNAEIRTAVQNYFNNMKKSWAKDNNFKYSLTIYRSQIMAAILQIAHVVNVEMPKLNNEDADIDLVFNNQTTQLPSLKDVVIND